MESFETLVSSLEAPLGVRPFTRNLDLTSVALSACSPLLRSGIACTTFG